uniref:Methyltransferase type 11 n=1 Tax=Cyanothece sp. (strain PCC 7425 / ATCC 29141) TaxID=395961 RepID=B8HV45_CYAP4
MKATVDFRSRLVSGLLAIKPLATVAKHQARKMIIQRAEAIGVPWTEQVAALQTHDWESELAQVQNPELVYPSYYLNSFHAYERGNLCWQAALEVEVAAQAVHARLWPEPTINGDQRLRQSYHDQFQQFIQTTPHQVLDLGCGVGMSTFALHALYPQAEITGVDLSPYFLAVAHYQSRERQLPIRWVHAAAEATGLPESSFDLVSLCLVCHELPQQATWEILQEAHRLLRPEGYLTIMDMNPRSPIYAQMPTYVLTLQKSTEPFLDEYFTFDLEAAIQQAGFQSINVASNSPRHRALVAQR